MKWLTFTAERVLYVDRGRDVIVCDRDLPRELLIGMTDAQVAMLRAEIESNVHHAHISQGGHDAQ